MMKLLLQMNLRHPLTPARSPKGARENPSSVVEITTRLDW